MTHNKVFITNLLNGLYKNIDPFLDKAYTDDATYISFMNGLANAIYRKLKMTEISLPIISSGVDFRKSTKYVADINRFDSSFVLEDGDAYFFSVAVDEKENLRVFTYELGHDNQNNIVYEFCEYFTNGTRKVLSKNKYLTKEHFASELLKVLKD